MHEAVVTIKKLWPVFKLGDKRVTLEAGDGTKYRLDAQHADGFRDGEVVAITYTEEQASAEFGGKAYKLIKNIKAASAPAQRASSATHATAGVPQNGGGPEKGMIIKETIQLLAAGKTPKEIIGFFEMAEEIYQHLKAPKVSQLEDTF